MYSKTIYVAPRILVFYMRGFCQQMAAKAPENPSPVREGNFVRELRARVPTRYGRPIARFVVCHLLPLEAQ